MEITVRTWARGKTLQWCRAASELETTVLATPSRSISLTASLTHLFCSNGIWDFPIMCKYSVLPISVVRYLTSVSGQLASQMHTKAGNRHFVAREAVLAHGSSKAEDCDLISCWSQLQVTSFPGTYWKKSPGLCFLKQYFTKQRPGDRLPGDIVRPRKDKSFLKRMVENIHCHIVVMTIFSRYGPQLHMFVWRKEDKNERIFLISLPFGPISLRNTQKLALQRMHSFESLWLGARAKVTSC